MIQINLHTLLVNNDTQYLPSHIAKYLNALPNDKQKFIWWSSLAKELLTINEPFLNDTLMLIQDGTFYIAKGDPTATAEFNYGSEKIKEINFHQNADSISEAILKIHEFRTKLLGQLTYIVPTKVD